MQQMYCVLQKSHYPRNEHFVILEDVPQEKPTILRVGTK
jgi:hypothetical protein